MAKKNNKNRNLFIIGGAVVLFVIAMFLMNSAGVLNLRSSVYYPDSYVTYSPSPTYIDFYSGQPVNNPPAPAGDEWEPIDTTLEPDDVLFGEGAPCPLPDGELARRLTNSASKIGFGGEACAVAEESSKEEALANAEFQSCLNYNKTRCTDDGGTASEECYYNTTEYTFSCSSQYSCNVKCSKPSPHP